MSAITIDALTFFPTGTFSPSTGLFRQRTGTTTDVPISGTYSGGTPAGVEVQSRSGAWVSIGSPVISGGVWSGTVPSVTVGTGDLQARWSDSPSTLSAVVTLAVGDAFMTWGDSTSVSGPAGSGSTSDTDCWMFVNSSGVQWWFRGLGAYHWLYLAQQLRPAIGYPVCFFVEGVGGTTMGHWDDASDTPYLANALADVALSKINGFKGTLGHISVNDLHAGLSWTAATVKAELATIAAMWAAQLGNAPPTALAMWADKPSSEWASDNDPTFLADVKKIRQGMLDSWAAGETLRGAQLIGEDYSTDHLHPDSGDNDVPRVGWLWYPAVLSSFYGGAVTSPRVSAVTIDQTGKIVIVTFASDLSTSVSSSVGGFRVKDNGTTVTITSAVVTAARVVTITLPSAIVGTCSVSWADGRDAALATASRPMGATVALPRTALGVSTITSPIEPFLDHAVTLALATVASRPM